MDYIPLAYRVRDAAKVSGLSVSKLYSEMQAGRLSSTKRCGRRLIFREDLDAFLKERTQGGAA